MLRKLFNSKSYNLFGLLLLVVITLMVFVEIKNGKFWLNDFKVFYQACNAFLNNDPVYGVSFGLETGFYKYSPFTLLLFIPYQTLSYFVASIIHVCCITLATWFVFRGTSLLWEQKQRIRWGGLLLVLLMIIVQLTREIHLGNVNMILVALLLLMLHLFYRKQIFLASLIWSVVVLTKPYFLLLGWPFLLQKEFRFLLYSICNVGLLIGLSMLAIGSNAPTMYQDWISAMTSHSGYLESHQTIFAIFNKMFQVSISSNGSYLVLILFIVLSAIPLQFSIPKRSVFIFYFFSILAIIPNFLITDTEHFLFATPLLIWIVTQLKIRQSLWLNVLFAIITIFFAIHSQDLLGKTLANQFNYWGVLGISNLLIVGFGTYLCITSKGEM